MNILFVSGHPAQVHNFRLVREELIKAGHKVFWLTTPKDIATNLLDVYDIPYELLQKPKKGIWGRIITMARNVRFEFGYLQANKIDICITRTCPYTSIAAWLLRIPHIILDDTEHAAASMLQKPFEAMVQSAIVPDCFWYEMRKDELRFPGNIELFYCHPKRFHLQEPWSSRSEIGSQKDDTALLNHQANDPSALPTTSEPELAGTPWVLDFPKGTRYAIVRFVKWDAYHDTKLIGGYTPEDKIHLVHSLIEAGLRVLITSEAELPAELEQYRTRVPIERMHDVMACAELFIGESSSMASECVVLGTPAIYVDEVGRGYTDEEAREGLLYMYRPYADKATWREAVGDDKDFILGGRKESIEKAIEIASPFFDRAAWRQRHQSWLATKFDCTAWLTWYIENYPQSEKMWRENRVEIEKRFK